MIKKISSIKVDAFENFHWTSPDLKELNLFYGWNGSGKTTLSRILQAYELGILPSRLPPSSQFSISTDTGSINQTALLSHKLKVKVFNEDFIKQHLDFDEGSANVIVTIGAGSKVLIDEVEKIEAAIGSKEIEIRRFDDELSKLDSPQKLQKESSDKVANTFSGTQLAGQGYYGRSYTVSAVKKLLEASEITSTNITDHTLSKEQIQQKLDLIESSRKSVSIEFTHIDHFKDVVSDVNKVLLHEEVAVEDIAELSSDQHLKDWVETGYKLHIDRKLSRCTFCEGGLSKERIERLSKFYTQELDEVKSEIKSLTTRLGQVSVDMPVTGFDEESSLFQGQATSFSETKSKLLIELQMLHNTVNRISKVLDLKMDHIDDNVMCFIPILYPEDSITKANEYCDQLNAIINEHNLLVSSRDEVVIRSGKELEYHLIADTLSRNAYFTTQLSHQQLGDKKDEAEKSLKSLQKDLGVKKGQMKNVHDAILVINKLLDQFFGDDFLAVDIDGETKVPQYYLKRRGELAKHLSEGEKSVLALCYFIASIREDCFKLSEGIVVIDDPVDSQDANYLYKTSSLIKSSLKESKQLLIMTHSFEFFNLIRDWFQSDRCVDKSTYHQVRYEGGDGDHAVYVEKLPNLLVQHKSEYQYLFFQLYQYANGRGSIDDPLVANMARRLLESFASFKWSTKTTTAFLTVVQDKFIDDTTDRAKQVAGEAVYKFVNEYSHNLDFSRDITATTMNSLEIAKKTLSFIKNADEEHYTEVQRKCDQEISRSS
ncbi:MAG: AAA family ATPase [Candidatus Uhrbacteria bacterium]|nr:AAA family ATPase [Patescibacteria group bacterium]MBU1907242.1 AAA family ATPase [Patescibacteria group bacterium]